MTLLKIFIIPEKIKEKSGLSHELNELHGLHGDLSCLVAPGSL